MTSLEDSIRIGGQNLVDILSPENERVPFWAVHIDEDGTAGCHYWWPTHNIGRWWDAMLRIEHATGFVVPAEVEGEMYANLARCFDAPLSVPRLLESASVDSGEYELPAGWIDKHSQREHLLALAALVRHRNSRWAERQGRRTIEALDEYILEDGHWDDGLIADRAGVAPETDLDPERPGRAGPREATWTHGRMIEGLIEFYDATGDDAAFELADRLATFHLDVSIESDGSIPPAPSGPPDDVVRYTGEYLHTHSLLNTYRGLYKYGVLTGQHDVVDLVAKTYERSVLPGVRESGFVSHDWGREVRGDVASAGDVAQLGCWLADHGYQKFHDDVARLVRARILPSQVTDDLDLEPAGDEDADRYAKLDERARGSFGGIYREAHGGTVPTTDVTAATLHTLCDVFEHASVRTPSDVRVNYHFDHETDAVRVECSRDDTARVGVTAKIDRAVSIRVPRWAPSDSVEVRREGEPVAYSTVGQFARIPSVSAGERVELAYDLPEKRTTERIDDTTYRIDWRGDEVVGISPNVDLLPFYPSADGA